MIFYNMSHSISLRKEGSKGAILREGREKNRRVEFGSISCVATCEWVAERCGPAGLLDGLLCGAF
jgi:hypothetical protein